MDLELTNIQAAILRQALQDAYEPEELDILLYERLNIRRKKITTADSYDSIRPYSDLTF